MKPSSRTINRRGRQGEDGLLIVLANFDQKGGLQNKYRLIAERLADRRRITIITWRTGRPVRADPQGVQVLRVPTLLPWHLDTVRLLAQLNTAISLASAVIAALTIRRRWSVILAGGLNPEGLAASIAGALLGRRWVADTWLPGPLGNVARLAHSPLLRLHLRLLNRATAVWAETDEIAEEILALGLPHTKVKRINWGIDMDHWKPVGDHARMLARSSLGLDPNRPVLAYWGRFDLRHKRLDILLEGWAQANLHNWQLLFAGDGPDRAKLEESFAKLDLRAVMLGWQDDPRPVVQAADIFALPTEFEATGLAMIEGLAGGIPGIVSNTAMYARMKPPGVVLVPNRSSEWSAAMRALAADPNERERLGRCGHEWVASSYDLNKTLRVKERLLFAPQVVRP